MAMTIQKYDLPMPSLSNRRTLDSPGFRLARRISPVPRAAIRSWRPELVAYNASESKGERRKIESSLCGPKSACSFRVWFDEICKSRDLFTGSIGKL